MTKIPIHDLTELEKKVIRYHIIKYPLITLGLDTSNLFAGKIHQDDVQKAAANLEHLGFYGHSNTTTRIFTHDGHYQARIYFKYQLLLRQIINPIKQFWFSHWRWIIGIAINIIALYFAWLELKK